MTVWAIHIANARGQLTSALPAIRAILAEAEARCGAVHAPVPLDLTVRGADYPMPSDMLIGGSAYSPGGIDLTLDLFRQTPDHELRDAILRAVFHEFHHVLRWDGPGYGETLGEALVTEGLAQHFLHEVMDCEPEPWEQALSQAQLTELANTALQQFDDSGYDHSAWFFGTGEQPNWAGYSLGFWVVGQYLAREPGRTALGCAHTKAERFKACMAFELPKA